MESGRKNEQKVVFELPKGGTIVMTALGPIQFGLPPETIKDSMVLGLGIPSYFVVPTERFVKKFGPSQGVNVAEFEFPAYCNFFFKGKRVCLIVNNDDVKERIQNVFQETLLGPREWNEDVDFDPTFPRERRPQLMKELAYFRKFGDKMINVDMLLAFETFDPTSNKVTLQNESGSEKVTIQRSETHYIVCDGAGIEIATIPAGVKIPPPERCPVLAKIFEPPLFGVTVLGSSHGFDPKGKTSGYVLWMNRRGIMVDPPPNSSTLLQENSIAPSLIDGVIVTHCHADHDAGTFQKILQEGKVTLMTTPTIFGCFIRKYAALSGLDEDFLKTVLVFRPVKIGETVKMRGGVLKFFYSLHSIPCVGFEAFFGGRSIVFSADHMNDPDRIRKLCDDGVLSTGRRDDLLEFPWHHDLILHEAGVPPIHTPMETLSALPDDVKKRLRVVHVSLDKIPEGSGLQVATPGVENTIILDNVEEPPHAKALEILDLVSSIPMFAGLTVKHASDVLGCTKIEHFKAGECIVKRGDIGTSFYAIMAGQAEVRVTKASSMNSSKDGAAASSDEEEEKAPEVTVKTYYAGDYFGEQALLSENAVRTADIYAIHDIKLLRFDRADFKWMLKNTDIVQKMSRLAKMRDNGSWDTMEQNTVLCRLSVSQKTQLETSFVTKLYKQGEYIWRASEPADCAILVQSGTLRTSVSNSDIVSATSSSSSSSTGSSSSQDEDGKVDSDTILFQSPSSNKKPRRDSLGKTRNAFSRGAFILDVDAVLDLEENDFDLYAAVDSTVLMVSRENLLDFFKNNPGVLLSLLHSRYVI